MVFFLFFLRMRSACWEIQSPWLCTHFHNALWHTLNYLMNCEVHSDSHSAPHHYKMALFIHHSRYRVSCCKTQQQTGFSSIVYFHTTGSHTNCKTKMTSSFILSESLRTALEHCWRQRGYGKKKKHPPCKKKEKKDLFCRRKLNLIGPSPRKWPAEALGPRGAVGRHRGPSQTSLCVYLRHCWRRSA